jgi:hypothetical protein
MAKDLKQEMEHNIALYREFGPKPGDSFAVLAGIGTVVMQSKTLPSGLIIEPFENMEKENGRSS